MKEREHHVIIQACDHVRAERQFCATMSAGSAPKVTTFDPTPHQLASIFNALCGADSLLADSCTEVSLPSLL